MPTTDEVTPGQHTQPEDEEVTDPSQKVLKRPAAKKSAQPKSKKAKKSKAVTEELEEPEKTNEKAQPVKPSPKAKSKGKTKAKAKAEAKPKPKPAAKPKTKVKDLKSVMNKGLNDAFGNDEQEDDDEEEDEDGDTSLQVRDRVKRNKFNSMLAAGMIPENIVKLYQDAKTKKSGARSAQTEIINTLFSRSADGKLVMQPHAPLFEAKKVATEQRSFNDKLTALPRTVFAGKYFNNDAAALDSAVATGEVFQVNMNGSLFYTFRSMEISNLSSKSSSHDLLQVSKKVNKATCAELVGHWDALDWNFNRVGAAEGATSSSSKQFSLGSGKQLALGDVPRGVL